MKINREKNNILLIIIGTLALALGVIGIIFPILPTTPFLLLTLICYTKGSVRFERWFKSTWIYKKHLMPFVLTKTMTNANKIKVLIFVTIVLLISGYFVNLLYVRIILGIVLLTHYYFFIFRIKSVSKTKLAILVEEALNKESKDLGKQ